MANNDVTTLAPDSQRLTLESGVVVDVQPLKTKAFFKLIKILTSGAGPALGNTSLFSGEVDEETFAGELIGLVILAVPNAEDETVEFLQAMVKPAGLVDRPYSDLNKADREKNDALWDKVYEDMFDPDINDTLSIIEAIIKREAGDLRKLGKRVKGMLEMAQKTGQLKSQDQNSSADSAEPSTSSAAPTAGQTKKSKNVPLDESDKSSQPSAKNLLTRRESVAAL